MGEHGHAMCEEGTESSVVAAFAHIAEKQTTIISMQCMQIAVQLWPFASVLSLSYAGNICYFYYA